MADATQVQRRRGTEAQCLAMTPADGEIIVDSTNDRLRLGDGVTAGGIPIPNVSDIQGQAFSYGTAGGTGNALTLTPSPALLAYADGVAFDFKASATNTGAATVNVNGLGTRSIYRVTDSGSVALSGGEIVNGGIYRLVYDGVQFQLKYYTQTVTPSGLIPITEFTVSTAVATVDLVSPVAYAAYRLEVDGYVGNQVYCRVSTNGGSSFLSGGYLSRSDASSLNSNTGSQLFDTTALYISNANFTSVNPFSCILESFGCKYRSGSNVRGALKLNGMTNSSTYDAKASVGIAADINAFRIYPISGNITAGTFRLFGYA